MGVSTAVDSLEIRHTGHFAYPPDRAPDTQTRRQRHTQEPRYLICSDASAARANNSSLPTETLPGARKSEQLSLACSNGNVLVEEVLEPLLEDSRVAEDHVAAHVGNQERTERLHPAWKGRQLNACNRRYGRKVIAYDGARIFNLDPWIKRLRRVGCNLDLVSAMRLVLA